jgi:hypothetical protein
MAAKLVKEIPHELEVTVIVFSVEKDPLRVPRNGAIVGLLTPRELNLKFTRLLG